MEMEHLLWLNFKSRNNNNNNNNNKIGVKLDLRHRYDHVPKSVEKIMKVCSPYYGTNKCEPTALFLTTNRTS